MKKMIAVLAFGLTANVHAACGPISCDEKGYDALGYGHENIGKGHDTPEKPYGNRTRGYYVPDGETPFGNPYGGGYQNEQGNTVHKPSVFDNPKPGDVWTSSPFD